MKSVLLLILLGVSSAYAAIDSYSLEATVKKFDAKKVTLEIAGRNYTFDREKLGNPVRNLSVGEKFEIAVDKKTARK